MSDAVARPVPPLPTLGNLPDDRIADAHPGVFLPRLLAVSRERQQWIADQLAAQCERDGLSGVVGRTRGITPTGDTVELNEEIRALVALEERERDRAADLARSIARLGLDSDQVLRDVAQWIVLALETLVAELGLDPADEPVLRAMRRAGIAARRATGRDEFDPDQFGPPPSPSERVAVLSAALARAERQAAEAANAPGGASGRSVPGTGTLEP